MQKKYIGVFDSGLGGLTVLRKIQQVMPNESTVYLGDHKHFPFGEKPPDLLQQYTRRAIEWLSEFGTKIIVIACNTSSVAGLSEYREKYPAIPIVGVVPGIKKAAEISESGTFLVMSTNETAKSTYVQDLIKEYASDKQVVSIGCKGLVTYVENGEISGEYVTKLISDYLEPYAHTPYDVIVLGCTHYPFLINIIRDVANRPVTFIDPSDAVALRVQSILPPMPDTALIPPVDHAYFTTGDEKQVEEVARKLLADSSIHFHHLDL